MLKLEAPWYTYQKKVKALFELDPNIYVGDVYAAENGKDYAFDVVVHGREKYLALDRVLNRIKLFGNVALMVNLHEEESGADEATEVYKTIFAGNRIVKDILDFTDATGTHNAFVRFVPEVVQFHCDNTADYNGNWTGLAQDIAREVFDDVAHGVHFCTADLRENQAERTVDAAEEPSVADYDSF